MTLRQIAITTLLTALTFGGGGLRADPTHPAGTATHDGPRDASAFSRAAPGFRGEDPLDFAVGKALFDRLWVTAPASTTSSDGLGPLFNARSCASCHPRHGRGRMDPGTPGLVVQLAGRDAVYGGQVQPHAIPGLRAEASVQVGPDGVSVTDLAHGPVTAALSPRLAQQLPGLGLIEAIPEADIRALADPEDADQDGVSGVAARGWSPSQHRWTLGRFGWRASHPTLMDQIAAAFSVDMGLGTPLRPSGHGDCTPTQRACLAAPTGDAPSGDQVEISGDLLRRVTEYVRALTLPARRPTAQTTRGEEAFFAARCHACHTPSHRTGDDGPAYTRGLTIWPYSDFLLHDMGPALADLPPPGAGQNAAAVSSEWRTPPLWGIGLTKTISGAAYLHDGRAKTLSEAIDMHAGEAATARRLYHALSDADRADLIAFLESL